MSDTQPSVFTHIINGDLPGRFVYRDDEVVAFLTISPTTPGHTLVVPVAQVDHWQRIDPALFAKLNAVAQQIGRGVDAAFSPARIGYLIAGLEVPHVHLHVFGANEFADFDLGALVGRTADAADLDAAAVKLRAALRELGVPNIVD